MRERARAVRLRVLTARVLVAALKRARFAEDRQKGSHLTLVHPDGRRALVPLHSRPLKIGTQRAILRKAGLSPAELGELL
jgi:predicted RNA binding protein YcfA (HicA-like mRNA interferase family)